MKNIQLFKPKFRIEECLTHIRDCLEKGWTGMGYKTVEFENAWRKYTGLPYAHYLNSATSGLHLAIKMFKERDGWDKNTEIISTPFTFVSTNHAVLYEGLKVVFADIDDYLCLDPKSIESRITSNTRAVIFVGMAGNSGQYEEVVKICRKHRLRLILDAAHMSGTRLNGRHVGFDCDVAVFSFQAVKNLPTADSGMICFHDKSLDEAVRKWSWLGINKDTFTRSSDKGTYKWKYDVEYPGYKYHGNSLTASLGLVGLKYLDEDNTYRRKIRTWYERFLKKHPHIKIIATPENCVTSCHVCQVVVENRDSVLEALNSMGIYPGVHYIQNTQYRMYQEERNLCPKSTYYSERILSLPTHLDLEEQDVRYVAESLITATKA